MYYNKTASKGCDEESTEEKTFSESGTVRADTDILFSKITSELRRRTAKREVRGDGSRRKRETYGGMSVAGGCKVIL